MNTKTTKGLIVALFMGGAFLASSQVITTFAGNHADGAKYFGDGGKADTSALSTPYGVAADASGNIYIADYGNNCIRKVNTSGVISTFAGIPGGGGTSGDGGQATAALLSSPTDVVVDASGNVYIADWGNTCIRKVNTSGVINTVAGTLGTPGHPTTGQQATAAALQFPSGVAVDASGNLYIADAGNSYVEKVVGGVITVIAGDGFQGAAVNGTAATAAQIGKPEGVAVDASGNIFIADWDHSQILKITGGIINVFAGNSVSGGYSGDGGQATVANINAATNIAVDASGNVYIADNGNNVIRKVNTSGVISTVAGNHAAGAGYFGDNGIATAAKLNSPTGVRLDAAGNMYIADYLNNVIRKVSPPCTFPVTHDSTADNGTHNGTAGVIPGGSAQSPFTYTWSANASSQTTQTATGLAAGTYTCTVVDKNNCVRVTTVVVKLSSGIGSIQSNNGQITIYPNPNNGKFTIQASFISSQSLMVVYNMLGEKIYEAELSPGTTQVSLNSNQAAGVYLYRAITKDGQLISTGKVVIQ